MYDEIDRQKLEEKREKRRQATDMEHSYNESNLVRGMDLLR